MTPWPYFFFDGENCSVDINSDAPYIFESSKNLRQITVKVHKRKGTTVLYDVYPFYPISVLKRLIRAKDGVPIDHRTLLYAGHVLAFEDGQTLQDYGIVFNNTTVHMVITRHQKYAPPAIALKIIKLQLQSEIFLFNTFHPGYTVLALKKMIETKEGITVQDQVLAYNGEVLEDEERVANYLNFPQDQSATIFLAVGNEPILHITSSDDEEH